MLLRQCVEVIFSLRAGLYFSYLTNQRDLLPRMAIAVPEEVRKATVH